MTCHGLISFFYYFTYRTVRDIIHHFQANQFVGDGLHGPPGCSFRRLGTCYQAYLCFYIDSYFSAAVFLLFPSQRCLHPLRHKPFRYTSYGTMGRSIRLFDPVISPFFIFGTLIQFQQYLGAFDSVAFPAFLYQCFLIPSFLRLSKSQCIVAFLLPPIPFFLEYSKVVLECKLLLLTGWSTMRCTQEYFAPVSIFAQLGRFFYKYRCGSLIHKGRRPAFSLRSAVFLYDF